MPRRARHPSESPSDPEAAAILAARLLVDGAVDSVAAAIAEVAKRGDDVRSLSAGLVRRHVEAMTLARLGTDGNDRRRAAILEVAEELMTLLELGFDGATTLLVGRAAAGRLDGDVTLHVRVYSTAPIGAIAALIVEAGHEEPRFVTATTRFGRLDRITLDERSDQAAVGIVVTRCLPTMRRSATVDLHTGRPIATLDLERLRAAIEALSRSRP